MTLWHGLLETSTTGPLGLCRVPVLCRIPVSCASALCAHMVLAGPPGELTTMVVAPLATVPSMPLMSSRNALLLVGVLIYA